MHFEPSAYGNKTLQQIALNYSPVSRRRLKPDAIPTLHILGGAQVQLTDFELPVTDNSPLLCEAVDTAACKGNTPNAISNGIH